MMFLQVMHLADASTPVNTSIAAGIALLPLTELLLDMVSLQRDIAGQHKPPNALLFLPAIPTLQSFTVMGCAFIDEDVSRLAAFLVGAPKLKTIAIHLRIASSRFPGHGIPRSEGRMHAALIELATAIASLETLTEIHLRIDRWHKEASDALFAHSPQWTLANIAIERETGDYVTVRNDSEVHLLGEVICSATKLESLNVCHHCPPDSSFSRLLDSGVSALPRLRELRLGDLVLTVENAAVLGAALQRLELPSLVSLVIEVMFELSKVKPTARDRAEVPPGHNVYLLDALEEDGSQLLNIVERLPNLPSLEKLALFGDANSKPRRVPQLAHAVSAVLRGSPRLRCVTLHYNDLQQQAVELLSRDLGNLKMLVRVDLCRGALGGGGARALVQCMRGHESLEEVKIKKCILEKDEATALAQLPNVVPNIRWLSLVQVDIGCEAVLEVLKEFVYEGGKFSIRLAGCRHKGMPVY